MKDNTRPGGCETMDPSRPCQTNAGSPDWTESLEHLLPWIAPRTVGRERVFERWAAVKRTRSEGGDLRDVLCLLSRELGALSPRGAVISLLQQRVKNVVLTLANQ